MIVVRVLLCTLFCFALLGTDAARACGCCDGESKIAPLGWSLPANQLMLRHEEIRGCERRVTVVPIGAGQSSVGKCYDLLADAPRLVPCTQAHVDWERQPAAFAEPMEPALSLSHPDLFARYVVRFDGAFRRTDIEVFLSGRPAPLAKVPTYEYEYMPPSDDETELFPLEVAILPVPGSPERALLLARGGDDSPGIGHRGFSWQWLKIPAKKPRPGVHWVRALPRFGSPKPELRTGTAVRANGAGLRALQGGNLEHALTSFEEAVAAEPSHTLARYNLACTLARIGAVEAALAQLVELLTHAPEPVRTERRDRARVDPDLESLRGQPEFERLVCGGPCGPLVATSAPVLTVAAEPSNAVDGAATSGRLAAASTRANSNVVPSVPLAPGAPTPPVPDPARATGCGSCHVASRTAPPLPFVWVVVALLLRRRR